MIPVQPQPEPPEFDDVVRIPGRQYLRQHPRAKASELKAFWHGGMEKRLWKSYGGVCAYLCLYVGYTTGAVSVDHFVPKSRNRLQAYEWGNYRLASLGINRKKGTKAVLDPFELRPNSFWIEFPDGEVKPNPNYEQAYRERCADTIAKLGLDSEENREWRKRHFDEYCSGDVSLSHLQKESPFVYEEIIRQHLERE